MMAAASHVLTPEIVDPASLESSLESSRLQYYARYFGDPVSRLFWRDGRLQMGMLTPHGEEFSQLLDSGRLASLFESRLLASVEPDERPCEGFDSVYHLNCPSRIVYWHEWSPKMLRAGSLRLLDLLARLAEQGLTLRNPHPWNLLYDGREFVYVNPGSIKPLDEEIFTRSWEKVARFFVRPLLLIENGHAHLARVLGGDAREGVLAEDVARLDGHWTELTDDFRIESSGAFLRDIAQRIEAFACGAPNHRWLEYFATDCDFSPGTSWTRKQEALEAMLDRPDIASVLDLGANTGHYARLAAERGREVIASDFDAALVDQIFEATREGAPLYPAVLDFSHPTQGQGVEGAWFPAATERLGADLVLCFALSHHMVFGKYRLDFEQVARGIRGFARKWALVEYVERGKIRPAEFRPEADSWYDVGHLESALRRHFRVVETLPPAKDGRRVLVCGPERSGL